jgi:hypothetical protein
MNEPRKIVQIAVAGMDENPDQWTMLYALCSDGSLWLLSKENSRSGEWQRLPPIPQEPTLPPVAQLRSAA